jgi:inhibitor of KinA sporulation pathway (predicted exonuclease)
MIKMDAFKQYLAIDLELNNGPDNSTPDPAIIQIGVAWGSYDHYSSDTIQTAAWYVNPHEPIYPRITELTGITDEDVQTRSTTHVDIALQLGEIIRSNDVFVNPVTWGGGDSDTCLREFRAAGCEFHHFGRRWIDVKTWHIFHMLARGRNHSGGLSKAMAQHGLQFRGTAHRADVDAANTLRLFFKMLDTQSQIMYHVDALKHLR